MDEFRNLSQSERMQHVLHLLETRDYVQVAELSEAFAVSEVTLGKAIGADKKVASPTTTFGAKDTIYASVATTGSAPSKTLTAKWTFQDGQTVKEGSETIAPTGPTVTEFHIDKKSGWPVGKYKVEISADGTPVTTKDFEVKK